MSNAAPSVMRDRSLSRVKAMVNGQYLKESVNVS